MGNKNDGKSLAEAQIYSALVAAESDRKIADKNIQSEAIKADAQKVSAHISGEAQISSAKLSADAQVTIARITNEPVILDANEATAYELIKKSGILKDLPAFEAKLASGDKEAQRDALNMEKALKKDGKDLTVDGKITSKTIAAAQGLIGENSEAILKYEEVLNKLSEKSPTVGGVKIQTSGIEHQ